MSKKLQVDNTDRKYRDFWYSHRKKWEGCQLCEIGCKTQHHVFARGSLPCKVLFVGEAPGESEDIIGIPFVGPAGKMLDKLLERVSGNRGNRLPRYAITNTICCLPQQEGKPRPPTESEMINCQPRLEHFIERSEATHFVALGKVAADRLIEILGKEVRETGSVLFLKHPSYLLRSGSETEKAKFVVRLTEWLKREKL